MLYGFLTFDHRLVLLYIITEHALSKDQYLNNYYYYALYMYVAKLTVVFVI